MEFRGLVPHSFLVLFHLSFACAYTTGKKDLNRLYNIMQSYDYSGNEWRRYEFLDESKKYTRNLIATVPGMFCLMLLCWNPEKGSPIHNHAGSECFMRVLQGRIVEKQYIVRGGEGDESAKCNWNKITCANIPPTDLIKSHENVYTEGGCTFINDSLGVHKVENPFKEAAVTLDIRNALLAFRRHLRRLQSGRDFRRTSASGLRRFPRAEHRRLLRVFLERINRDCLKNSEVTRSARTTILQDTSTVTLKPLAAAPPGQASCPGHPSRPDKQVVRATRGVQEWPERSVSTRSRGWPRQQVWASQEVQGVAIEYPEGARSSPTPLAASPPGHAVRATRRFR